MLRNIVLGGLLLTLAIIALLYNQYRLKQKNNRTLLHVLDEKEWLLKEIHHRVKNNLQMVVSLLGSQSAYLSNEALEAIKDSQNRVFSISLIHQNLYQNDNLAFIEMSNYVPELVSYIRDIFGVKNQICFNLRIEPLKLNMPQAVSLGLILNEAITNCIKYAFQAKRKGDMITIRMAFHERGIVHLEIADNGVGLPADFDSKKPKSLGLRLIKGLTEDLGGSFSIGSRDGTTVSIHFVPNIAFEKAIEIIASDENATATKIATASENATATATETAIETAIETSV